MIAITHMKTSERRSVGWATIRQKTSKKSAHWRGSNRTSYTQSCSEWVKQQKRNTPAERANEPLPQNRSSWDFDSGLFGSD